MNELIKIFQGKNLYFIDDYVIVSSQNSLSENVELYNKDFEKLDSIEINDPEINFKREINFTTKDNHINFNRILLNLNNGFLLIQSNSFFERESRDGVDLSQEYDFLKIVDLKTLNSTVIFSNKVGRFFGKLSCEFSEKLSLNFNCFSNFLVSDVFLNKFIVYCNELPSDIFSENIKEIQILKSPSIQYSNSKKSFYLMDINLNMILNNVSLIEIITFLSSKNEEIKKYSAIISTLLKIKNE